MCVNGPIVDPPPPSVYLALRAGEQARRFVNISSFIYKNIDPSTLRQNTEAS